MIEHVPVPGNRFISREVSVSRGHDIMGSEYVGALGLDAYIRALLWSAYVHKG